MNREMFLAPALFTRGYDQTSITLYSEDEATAVYADAFTRSNTKPETIALDLEKIVAACGAKNLVWRHKCNVPELPLTLYFDVPAEDAAKFKVEIEQAINSAVDPSRKTRLYCPIDCIG